MEGFVWREDAHITPKVVIREMLKCIDGGDWFKRHFIGRKYVEWVL